MQPQPGLSDLSRMPTEHHLWKRLWKRKLKSSTSHIHSSSLSMFTSFIRRVPHSWPRKSFKDSIEYTDSTANSGDQMVQEFQMSTNCGRQKKSLRITYNARSIAWLRVSPRAQKEDISHFHDPELIPRSHAAWAPSTGIPFLITMRTLPVKFLP